ncbi:NAD-binding protein [Halodesulfurarchaeum sp. HSR-GB]|uniref:potassium channel family protein n=1 Tax=Halodesulfurarchaeum sp. HSR-GB TaxID=3074077 RepID=UPI00285DED4A|nr:NAD-binding protein [Halodesulfurarchaeum sp. HSR-GB]MDR5657076.1 NAD-binding protein [Halodesulfurarchaeum sp. HSR-GB]
MERTRRRGVYYVLSFLGALVLYTILYKFGMSAFEGEHRTVIQAFQIVVESFTTTGYGEDAPWSSPQIQILVVLMQFTGIFFIFLTLPLFLVPWIEERLEDTIPRTYQGEDHVVICGFSDRSDVLIDDLEVHGLDYVLLVDAEDRARSLSRAGYNVVLGDPESTATFSNLNVGSAQAVVLDGPDERNAAMALSVRELNDTVRLVAFVEDPSLTRYLLLAGVDEPLHPRELLGRGLADKVSSVITTQLGETVDISADLEVIELPVFAGSDVHGETLGSAGIREQTGAAVIGAWVDGKFVPNPTPETTLTDRTVLLVAGTESQLEAVMDRTRAGDRLAHEDVVMAGYGEVGEAVCNALQSANVTCRIIDLVDRNAVDVVGNATEAAVLREAGLAEAGAFIVSLNSDTDAIFATLVARELNPDLEIIVRANDADNVAKLYSAGADYVLPLPTVSGRMLASSILDEDVISYDTQIDIVRMQAPGFEGSTIEEAAIRERTGCTIIAVERGEETYSDVGPEFEIRDGDSLVVVGTDEDLLRFQELGGVGSLR